MEAERFLEKVEAAMSAVEECEFFKGVGYRPECDDEEFLCSCIWELPENIKEGVIEKLQIYDSEQVWDEF